MKVSSVFIYPPGGTNDIYLHMMSTCCLYRWHVLLVWDERFKTPADSDCNDSYVPTYGTAETTVNKIGTIVPRQAFSNLETVGM